MLFYAFYENFEVYFFLEYRFYVVFFENYFKYIFFYSRSYKIRAYKLIYFKTKHFGYFAQDDKILITIKINNYLTVNCNIRIYGKYNKLWKLKMENFKINSWLIYPFIPFQGT